MTKPTVTKFSLLRRYFLTGLAFLAPFAVTIFVLVYLFQLVNNIIGKPIDTLFSKLLGYPVFGIGFGVAVLLVLVIGFIASTVIGRRLFAYGEKMLLQLPLFRNLYPPAKQVVEFFVNPQVVQFGAVVLVRYLNPNSYVIGFITGGKVKAITEATGKLLVNVFVPFTPTPITGLLLLVPEEDLIPLNLTVEEALKLIVSGGVVVPSNQANVMQKTISKGP